MHYFIMLHCICQSWANITWLTNWGMKQRHYQLKFLQTILMVSYNAKFYLYLAFSKPVQLYPWWLYFSAWNPIHCQHIECHNAINKPAVKVINTSVSCKTCPVSNHFSLIPAFYGTIRSLETEWKIIVYHSNYVIAKYNHGNPIIKFLINPSFL